MGWIGCALGRTWVAGDIDLSMVADQGTLEDRDELKRQTETAMNREF